MHHLKIAHSSKLVLHLILFNVDITHQSCQVSLVAKIGTKNFLKMAALCCCDQQHSLMLTLFATANQCLALTKHY